MIIKTKYTRQSAMGWVGYIAYKSRISDMEKDMKGVFNGLGRKATRRDIEWIINTSEDTGMARMIIFAPATYMHPIFLSEYTLETLWKFLNETGRSSVRFVYALHYNTPHPHTHAVLSAYYPDDLVMYEKEIKRMMKIAEGVFSEEIEISKKMQEFEKEKKSIPEELKEIARFESMIEKEHIDEEREMNRFMKEIKSIEDVMKYVRGVEIGL